MCVTRFKSMSEKINLSDYLADRMSVSEYGNEYGYEFYFGFECVSRI